MSGETGNLVSFLHLDSAKIDKAKETMEVNYENKTRDIIRGQIHRA